MAQLILNPLAERSTYNDIERGIVSAKDAARVGSFLKQCPRYESTPLHDLPCLAAFLGIGAVDLKDESTRFGSASFKALGAPYALAMALKARLRVDDKKRQAGDTEHFSPRQRADPSTVTACCASDGNHGRALALAARHFGVGCVVFVHEGVSTSRRDAITALGASVREVAGNYDDSVSAATAAARQMDWLLIADTAHETNNSVVANVMRGYSVLVAECLDQASADPDHGHCPWTHVFVQAGVGGLAAAVAGMLADCFGDQRPTVVSVEPAAAACVAATLKTGKPTKVTGALDTLMAMLACGEMSASAWAIIQRRVDFALSIEDRWAVEAVKRLAAPLGHDPSLAIGESGGAGLGGLLAVCGRDSWRRRLSLTHRSRVLLIGTEGITDAARYQSILLRGPALC